MNNGIGSLIFAAGSILGVFLGILYELWQVGMLFYFSIFMAILVIIVFLCVRLEGKSNN